MSKRESIEPYKGTRDFYPADMAVQQYIFDTWSSVAESFGFERYDASVLEPSELYRQKSSEEIVDEQTYTFTDRGDREVTLRPEMTPTAARMVAAKRRELALPLRWYSIPNLFRYERPQRGRLREHWQLNCDIFGVDHYSADVELIALGYHVLTTFGADSDMFEIRISDRGWLNATLANAGLTEEESARVIALLDRKDKIDNFDEELKKITTAELDFDSKQPSADSNLAHVIAGLGELGITNVTFSPSTVRGFTYYTGTVFEFFDTSGENTRSLLGGGRYDNLTEKFGGEPVPGIGFGMGDICLRDFLETHDLLTANITAPTVMVVPTDPALNINAEKIAQQFRAAGISTSVDLSSRKLGKKLSSAGDALVEYALVLGDDELKSETYALKNLISGSQETGAIDKLIKSIQ
jgi:histidyl-tRNA synthetase